MITNKMKTLIIVDMQKGFINKNNEFLVKNIENLLKNHKFDRVFATKFVNNLDSQYVKLLNFDRMCDAKSQEFAVTLPDTAVILEKTSYALPTEFVGGEQRRFSSVALIMTPVC